VLLVDQSEGNGQTEYSQLETADRCVWTWVYLILHCPQGKYVAKSLSGRCRMLEASSGLASMQVAFGSSDWACTDPKLWALSICPNPTWLYASSPLYIVSITHIISYWME
jgi:hypothetical protein